MRYLAFVAVVVLVSACDPDASMAPIEDDGAIASPAETGFTGPGVDGLEN